MFVANKIKSITNPEQWQYVKSEDNLADHTSRGLMAHQLVSSNWLTDPEFLWKQGLPAGNIKVGEIRDDDPELQKVQVLNTKAKEGKTLLDRL